MKPPSICFALIFPLVLAVACAGCHSPSQYISPRIIGRVMDERTEQPIKGVHVRRASDMPQGMDRPKGGELLKQAPPILTGADGRFVVGSVRCLAFIRRLQWYSATLSFTHPRYEHLWKTYSLAVSTNTPAGEPLVQAGDISLRPLIKLQITVDKATEIDQKNW